MKAIAQYEKHVGDRFSETSVLAWFSVIACLGEQLLCVCSKVTKQVCVRYLVWPVPLICRYAETLYLG